MICCPERQGWHHGSFMDVVSSSQKDQETKMAGCGLKFIQQNPCPMMLYSICCHAPTRLTLRDALDGRIVKDLHLQHLRSDRSGIWRDVTGLTERTLHKSPTCFRWHQMLLRFVPQVIKSLKGRIVRLLVSILVVVQKNKRDKNCSKLFFSVFFGPLHQLPAAT